MSEIQFHCLICIDPPSRSNLSEKASLVSLWVTMSFLSTLPVGSVMFQINQLADRRIECRECKFCKSGKTNLCGKGMRARHGLPTSI